MILHSGLSCKQTALKLLKEIELKRISLNLTISQVVEGADICLTTYMSYKDHNFSKLTFAKFFQIQDFFSSVELENSRRANARVSSHLQNKFTMDNIEIRFDIAMSSTEGDLVEECEDDFDFL